MEKQWQIKSGPSKFDLMLAVFHRTHGEVKVSVKVQEAAGEASQMLRLTILVISRYDLNANHPRKRNPQTWRFIGRLDHGMVELSVVGEYSTSSRKGWLSLVGDDFLEDLGKLQLVY
jgi:hypothetical protein